MERNPLDDFLNEDDEDIASAYELYKVDMDARFEHMDAEELCAAWKQAERSRFTGAIYDDLVHALLPMVPAICKRIKERLGRPSADQWDDAIQAGNLAIVESLRSWNPEGGSRLSAWAYRYAYRDVMREVEFLEADSTKLEKEDSDLLDDSDEGETAARMEREVDIETLNDNLHKLTDLQAIVVKLQIRGMSLAEIGESLGMTRQAAQQVLERAILILRDALTK